MSNSDEAEIKQHCPESSFCVELELGHSDLVGVPVLMVIPWLVCVCSCHMGCPSLREGLDGHCHGSIGDVCVTRIRNMGNEELGAHCSHGHKTIP